MTRDFRDQLALANQSPADYGIPERTVGLTHQNVEAIRTNEGQEHCCEPWIPQRLAIWPDWGDEHTA
jgi:hypothetical protein